MFPALQHSQTFAAIAGHQPQLLYGQVDALGAGRAISLGEDPGIGHGRAADHDAVTPGLLLHADGVFVRLDVAVSEDGNARRFYGSSDPVPVCLSAIALNHCSRVNGDGLSSRIFNPLDHFEDVDIVVVPTDTGFDGNWNVDGLDGAVNSLVEEVEVSKGSAEQLPVEILFFFLFFLLKQTVFREAEALN